MNQIQILNHGDDKIMIVNRINCLVIKITKVISPFDNILILSDCLVIKMAR